MYTFQCDFLSILLIFHRLRKLLVCVLVCFPDDIKVILSCFSLNQIFCLFLYVSACLCVTNKAMPLVVTAIPPVGCRKAMFAQ